MLELYWLTRLDGIITVALILTVVSAGTLICTIPCIASDSILNSEESKKYAKNIFKACCIILSIAVTVLIFVPTKKDALIIYDTGRTLEYLQSNDTAKQLPDKCIQALDKLLEDYLSEEQNSSK